MQLFNAHGCSGLRVVQRPTVFEVAEVLLMTVVVKSGGRLSLAVDGDGGAVCGIDTILYSV